MSGVGDGATPTPSKFRGTVARGTQGNPAVSMWIT